MELRVLKYFLTVAEEENITRAAEVLHLTQPTLSRQINSLEEDLGTKLFVRGKRKVSLTEAGFFLKKRAEEIIGLLEKTERDFIDQRDMVSGIISIGCVESNTARMLAKYLTAFNEKYPNVTYNIFSGTGDDIKEKIDRGSIEIGVLLEPVNYENYEFIRFDEQERWGILTRPESVFGQKEYITQADIIGQPLINSNRTIVRNEIRNWFALDESQLKVSATFNLNSGVAFLVENGFGHAICIEGSTTMIDPAKLVFRPLFPELFTRCVLIWRKDAVFSHTVSKFIEYVKLSVNT